jgi:hypothetical protein
VTRVRLGDKAAWRGTVTVSRGYFGLRGVGARGRYALASRDMARRHLRKTVRNNRVTLAVLYSSV